MFRCSPRSTVEELYHSGRLRLDLPRIDRLTLPVHPRPAPTERVRAMLLGVAIGDSLGNTSESLNPDHRHSQYCWIEEYLPNRHADGRAVGLPSDDTQLTFWALRSLLQCQTLDRFRLAEAFCRTRIFGLGKTMRAWLRQAKSASDPWDARQPSAGNGAVMKVAGLIAPHLLSGCATTWLWDVIVGSALTHDDPTSTAACVAFANLLEGLLHCQQPPGSNELIETFAGVMEVFEGEVLLRSRVPHSDYLGPCYRRVSQVASMLHLSASEVGRRLYSGAFLLETMPAVLHLVARYRNDPQQCILAAVNETRDNDTIASMCAAARGALYGTAAFRPSWIEGLLGRTTQNDDGEVFRLLDQLESLATERGP